VVHWYQLKDPIADLFGLSHDAMHVHVGLTIFLVVAMLLRKVRGGVWLALGAVLLAELGNEVGDSFDWIRWTGRPNLLESAKDVVSTVLWPLVFAMIWTLARRTGGTGGGGDR
jgi:hypothetical protein